MAQNIVYQAWNITRAGYPAEPAPARASEGDQHLLPLMFLPPHRGWVAPVVITSLISSTRRPERR